MTLKLLTEDNLESLSFKGGCIGSSESTLVKMPHCWKSHATAHMSFSAPFLNKAEKVMACLHKEIMTVFFINITSKEKENFFPLIACLFPKFFILLHVFLVLIFLLKDAFNLIF